LPRSPNKIQGGGEQRRPTKTPREKLRGVFALKNKGRLTLSACSFSVFIWRTNLLANGWWINLVFSHLSGLLSLTAEKFHLFPNLISLGNGLESIFTKMGFYIRRLAKLIDSTSKLERKLKGYQKQKGPFFFIGFQLHMNYFYHVRALKKRFVMEPLHSLSILSHTCLKQDFNFTIGGSTAEFQLDKLSR